LINKIFRISFPKKKITTEHHFWELNHKDTTFSKVEESIRKAGFEIESVNEKFYQSFYILGTKGHETKSNEDS